MAVTALLRRPSLRVIPSLAILVALTLVLATCSRRPGLQQRTQTLGTLRVALTSSATTYVKRDEHISGFEYDLVHRFARNLDLELVIVEVDNRQAAINAVRNGHADMAAGLAVSRSARGMVHVTPPYATVNLDVVYNAKDAKPKSLADLNNRLTIRPHSALREKLVRRHPELKFATAQHANTEALMAAVARGDIHSTIASETQVALNQRYHPNLRVAFTLPDIKLQLAWAFPRHGSEKLYNQAIAWLEYAKQSDQVHTLRQRYFAHADQLGFVGGRIFAKQINKRLPKWKKLFEQAGAQYELDWHLLAAMSYQESHWNPQAVSSTGVRGLMMLTQATADELGLSNRQNPEQSIDGGALYFINQRKRLPETIKEPDRTWMALASYNVGFGHLMDARRLVDALGKNPNLWVNVRTALPKLAHKKYYQQTRYGYARGFQAVEYVSNIRAYYDILLWKSANAKGVKDTGEGVIAAPHPETRRKAAKSQAITIESPAL